MDVQRMARAQAHTKMIAMYGDRIRKLADKRTSAVQTLRMEGMSWAEIGRQMGMSPQAVRKIASRSMV